MIFDVSVVIATKGRPLETAALLERLKQQTYPLACAIVVGASDDDIPDHADVAAAREPNASFDVHAWTAAEAGLTRQRNEAVYWLRNHGHVGSTDIIVFFDDDFRPASDWIACCVEAFSDDTRLAGLTGQILADGVHGLPLSEGEADAYLDGKLAARPHWASGAEREISSVYGCNMAFAGRVMAACVFDESLPLYGWQEDRDMTGQAARFGSVRFSPNCRGVHLGARGARASGVRLGYSQIANMIYLGRKGTVSLLMALRFIGTSLAANMIRSIVRKNEVDHPGRLKGNALALLDVLRGRCEPSKILDLA